jgi:type IV pilus assembly protein PilQ
MKTTARTLNAFTLLAFITLTIVTHAQTNQPNRFPETPPYDQPITLVTLTPITPTETINIINATTNLNLTTQNLPGTLTTHYYPNPTAAHHILNHILTTYNLTVTHQDGITVITPYTPPPEETYPRTYPIETDPTEIINVILNSYPTITTRIINNGRHIIINGTETQHSNIVNLIQEHQNTIQTSTTHTLIPIQYDLVDLTNILKTLYPNTTITALPNASAISVAATPTQTVRIQQFVVEHQAFLREQDEQGNLPSDVLVPVLTTERTYRISNTTATSIAATIQSVLAIEGEQQTADYSFVADDRTNKLIIRAPEWLHPRIQGIIDELDEPSQQVRVNVRIQEITQREAETLGLRITADAGALLGSVINGAAQFVFDPLKAITSLNINFILDTLEGQGYSRTLDNATLVMNNNTSAAINSGGSINASVQVGSGADATTETRNIPFGTNINVTPRATNDNRIELTLTGSVTGIEGDQERLTGLRVSNKTITTTVTINNQEVLIIGGLNQNAFTTTTQGVPILSAIPIIGNLFKNETAENRRSELIFVITAEIINPTPTVTQSAATASLQTTVMTNGTPNTP